MRVVIFTHSIASDWNHGHVHFLRGLARALLARGHEVTTYEPEPGWSAENLVRDHGQAALHAYGKAYPELPPLSRTYPAAGPFPTEALADADLVLVQEWNDPALVQALLDARGRYGYRLYLHDAHHRSLTAPDEIRALQPRRFDAVLAFGDVIRDHYLATGLAQQAFTWHEAADVRTFHPQAGVRPDRDVVWIGNWGDEERTRTFHEHLLGPARRLGLSGTVHGVRYPPEGIEAVRSAGLEHAGYLPNHEVPGVFARHCMTVHLPREAYSRMLPGIPTIRVFEALACGIPLVSAPWQDTEHLFTPGRDFLVAHDPAEMEELLSMLRDDDEACRRLAEQGRSAILARHTCDHRASELEAIDGQVRGGMRPLREEAQVRGAAPVAAGGGPKIAFFGSSLVSSMWNGAATYYRGLLRALASKGCQVTFYEPDAYDRQANRDIADPEWARVVVYSADGTEAVQRAVDDAADADVVVKASGVGVHDAFLESAVLRLKRSDNQVVFWDVDAPATLDRLQQDPQDPLAGLIPRYDVVCTYGGGAPVVEAYEALGARRCVPIYNAVDPDTHHPVAPDARFACDLAFLGNRLPDREARVRHFFLDVAKEMPEARFVLGGSGWEAGQLPANVRHVGHVPTRDHNAFNRSPRAVLNIHRESMARYGHSPATRVFEAAGAGACVITDAFRGLEEFFEPGKEILVASTGAEVKEILEGLDAEQAAMIGERARARALRDHTYDDRANQVLRLLASDLPQAVVS